MKITVTVEIDTASGGEDVENLRDLLQYLTKVTEVDDDSDVPSEADEDKGEPRVVEPEQLARLRRLREGLTESQRKVWDVFMQNPDAIAASKLKKILPELKSPGTLPGVFRATHRWVNQLGGEKHKCPFIQVKWTGSEGVYRGLWAEEVELLKDDE